jgi:hypothetical protein
MVKPDKEVGTRLYVNVMELGIILLTPHYSQGFNMNAITCNRLTVIAFYGFFLCPRGAYYRHENIKLSKRQRTHTAIHKSLRLLFIGGEIFVVFLILCNDHSLIHFVILI